MDSNNPKRIKDLLGFGKKGLKLATETINNPDIVLHHVFINFKDKDDADEATKVLINYYQSQTTTTEIIEISLKEIAQSGSIEESVGRKTIDFVLNEYQRRAQLIKNAMEKHKEVITDLYEYNEIEFPLPVLVVVVQDNKSGLLELLDRDDYEVEKIKKVLSLVSLFRKEHASDCGIKGIFVSPDWIVKDEAITNIDDNTYKEKTSEEAESV